MFKRKSIAISVAFLALIAIFILAKIIIAVFWSEHSAIRHLIPIQSDKNTFSNFSYKTYDSKGQEVVLHAENVSEEKKDVYKFEKVKSTLTLSDGETVLVSANKIVALQKNKMTCEFIGDVQLSTSSGIVMETEISKIDFSKKLVEGGKRISISNDNTKISADRYSVNLELKIADLFGNVTGTMPSGDRISAARAVISFDSSSKNHIKNVRLSGNPIIESRDYTLKSRGDISYNHAFIKSAARTYLIYTHNKDKYHIKSDRMLATLDDSKIKSVEVCGNLIINAKNVIVKADRGTFCDHKAVVVGNVAIINERGTIFGETADVDFNTGRVSLRKSRGILSGG